MRVRSARRLLALALWLPCAGCNPLGYGELGLLAPDTGDPRVDVIAKDERGEDCVSWFSFSKHPSHGRAVADAIAKVKDANAMTDVTFGTRPGFFSSCAWVRGNVGRLE